MPAPTAIGTPVKSGPRTWVQTDRAAHEAWAALTMESPRAAALMHHLVALMGHQNAVVIPQKTLAKIMGCSERTIRNALTDLVKGNWIQVVQLGSAGTVNAYVVNSAVAWGEKRDHMPGLSIFHARVIADSSDQKPETMDSGKRLRRVPALFEEKEPKARPVQADLEDAIAAQTTL